jgi:hypothetical protein
LLQESRRIETELKAKVTKHEERVEQLRAEKTDTKNSLNDLKKFVYKFRKYLRATFKVLRFCRFSTTRTASIDRYRFAIPGRIVEQSWHS